MDDKPYSAASERNREPILAVLREHFADRKRVLEVGSGTGQHAVYFAAALPHLEWQASDRRENLRGIRQWLDEARLHNTPAPLELEFVPRVRQSPDRRLPRESAEDGKPEEAAIESAAAPGMAPRRATGRAARYDAAFTANTLHIMSWPEVEAMFAGLARVLDRDATLVVYGPFNIDGRFTSESNAAFDASLKSQAPHMGIRDRGAVVALAGRHALRLAADVPMPANNRCLVFRSDGE